MAPRCPWKTDLFTRVVRAAVSAAEPHGVPVTVKMRMGIDADHITYLDAGRIAEAEGAAAVALHARTAARLLRRGADWAAIARLKEAVTSVPVLGNGDIWSAEDAIAMVARTGCDGVVVGRGCLGRPWLFADLAAAFAGQAERVRPSLGQVAGVLRRHAALLVAHYGDELRACRDLRKHVSWYLKGYPSGTSRAALGMVDSQQQLADLLGRLDLGPAVPGRAVRGPARPNSRRQAGRAAPRLARRSRPHRRGGANDRRGRAVSERRVASAGASSAESGEPAGRPGAGRRPRAAGRHRDPRRPGQPRRRAPSQRRDRRAGRRAVRR